MTNDFSSLSVITKILRVCGSKAQKLGPVELRGRTPCSYGGGSLSEKRSKHSQQLFLGRIQAFHMKIFRDFMNRNVILGTRSVGTNGAMSLGYIQPAQLFRLLL